MRNGYTWTAPNGGLPRYVDPRTIEQVKTRTLWVLEAKGHWVTRARNRRHAQRQFAEQLVAEHAVRGAILEVAAAIRPMETPLRDEIWRG